METHILGFIIPILENQMDNEMETWIIECFIGIYCMRGSRRSMDKRCLILPHPACPPSASSRFVNEVNMQPYVTL